MGRMSSKQPAQLLIIQSMGVLIKYLSNMYNMHKKTFITVVQHHTIIVHTLREAWEYHMGCHIYDHSILNVISLRKVKSMSGSQMFLFFSNI